MLKRFWMLLAAICGTCAVCAGAPKVEFHENGDFKIVQLTDLHFVPASPEDCEKTFARMDYIVREEKPDFIAVTGDVIFGSPARDMLQQILDRLDSYRVPFCVVFGNHDAEQDLTRAEMSGMIVSARYSVNTLNSRGELDDVRIPVMSSAHPDTDPLDLYFLDSHDYSRYEVTGGYAWFTQDQIQWLRKECGEATRANGGANVPSLAFFHIPIPEFLEAWVLAEEKKHNSVVGVRGEYGGHPKINSGMFAAMLETGSVIGVFCGHDHNNDYIVPHYGIALVYGQYSGEHTVYNNLAHGTRVITVKEGERAFSTWIHEDDGHIQGDVKFEDGKLTWL